MDVSVVGLGYLGLIQAIVLAESGHRVTAVDTDRDKVQKLQGGVPPFYEPELLERMTKQVNNQSLLFTDSFGDWVGQKELHFICVGTPMSESGELDTTALYSALDSLAKDLKEDSIIVGRSTVEVGTSKKLKDYLSSKVSTTFYLAWNPEFLSEGTAFQDSFHPERIVIGVEEEVPREILLSFYQDKIYNSAPVLIMDLASSELVKAAANSFLAMKISYINGLAGMAEEVGADIKSISQALGLDSRIGQKFLRSGLGFGGGCIPKDLASFAETASKLSQNHFSNLLVSALEINKGRVENAVSTVKGLFAHLPDISVCVLGASFKPNTDDVRSSQALALTRKLLDLGVWVRIHDPKALPNVQISHPKLEKVKDLETAISGVDLVIVATEWSAYSELNPDSVVDLPTQAQILDLRNSIDPNAWRNAGWNVVRLSGNDFGSENNLGSKTIQQGAIN
jgi:UDPglucose 6-dehydrogenase